MVKRVCAAAVVLSFVAVAGGCGAYYTPPGRAADMEALGVKPDGQTDASIAGALAKQPLARLPTGVAVARVQAPGYKSMTSEGWGSGRYSLVTTRDVEEPAQVERLGRLPGVFGIAPLNRLLLPAELKTDLELRQAAAKLHADMLLVYTLDTTFAVDDKLLPLSVFTLGLSPNQVANVTCTASAVLMDTRNGYVYAVAERTAKESQLASAWTSGAAVDDSRRRAEKRAFADLVGELETVWSGVYNAGMARQNAAMQAAQGQPSTPPPGGSPAPVTPMYAQPARPVDLTPPLSPADGTLVRPGESYVPR